MTAATHPYPADHVHDPYPSRVGGESAILPRVDPVVHADAAARGRGPLGADDLDRFEREGFLVIESFFPASRVESLREELADQIRERRDDPSPEVIREPGGDGVRSIFRIHRTNAVFSGFAADARMVRVVQQILGGAVYVHQSRVNLKPGFEGREFQWHSDFETWHVEDGMPRMRAVSCSINLETNYEFNGPLMVIPGSHHHFLACAGRTPDKNYLESLRRQEYGVPERDHLAWLVEQGGIEAVKGPPGTITLFECNIMHGSNGNITPYPRSNVFFVYNGVDNALVAPFGGIEPRPEYIASRGFTPL